MDFATGGISGGFYGAGMAGGRFDRENLGNFSLESQKSKFIFNFF
jgi:hypothetical protein